MFNKSVISMFAGMLQEMDSDAFDTMASVQPDYESLSEEGKECLTKDGLLDLISEFSSGIQLLSQDLKDAIDNLDDLPAKFYRTAYGSLMWYTLKGSREFRGGCTRSSWVTCGTQTTRENILSKEVTLEEFLEVARFSMGWWNELKRLMENV